LEQKLDLVLKELAELKQVSAVAPKNVNIGVINSGANSQNTSNHVEVYNVCEYLNFKEDVVKQFMSHIGDGKILDYVRAEPRQAILDMVRDIFFNIKKKKNMILAVRDLDPLEVFLHYNQAWQKENPIMLTELVSVAMMYCREVVDKSAQKSELGSLANLNHMNGTYTGMSKEIARVAYDNTYKAVAAVGPLPD
jgi:hypothetical protein